MLKKFLMCFSLLFVLMCVSTAQAKPAELTEINAYESDKETVRIEISYRGGHLDASDISSKFSSESMRLESRTPCPAESAAFRA